MSFGPATPGAMSTYTHTCSDFIVSATGCVSTDRAGAAFTSNAVTARITAAMTTSTATERRSRRTSSSSVASSSHPPS